MYSRLEAPPATTSMRPRASSRREDALLLGGPSSAHCTPRRVLAASVRPACRVSHSRRCSLIQPTSKRTRTPSTTRECLPVPLAPRLHSAAQPECSHSLLSSALALWRHPLQASVHLHRRRLCRRCAGPHQRTRPALLPPRHGRGARPCPPTLHRALNAADARLACVFRLKDCCRYCPVPPWRRENLFRQLARRSAFCTPASAAVCFVI